ncbi:glycosyltransferase family 4 protein [Candidatus Woesearchaeota archaeon]|nr:glycosyltransferase family 4 protein [Candidatus Woesearchaeota archaeon]
MRICILSPIYPTFSNPPLGIFVHEQAKYLAKKGHSVHVITFGNNEGKDYEIKDGVLVHRIKIYNFLLFKGAIFALLMVKKLIILNKKFDFDVVHSHFVGPLTVLIGLASKLTKKRLVTTVHGIGLLTENPIKKAMVRFYLQFPSKIICVSDYVSKLVSECTSKNKIVIINNGVDAEKLRPTLSAMAFKEKLGMKNEKILLSIGALIERKGIDIILNSLPIILKSYKNLKYFIIGKGAEKENLQNLVKKLGLEKYVVFTGIISDDYLANFYNICDIFILMSRTINEKEGVEGFGIAYIEASYFGKPVIGGKSGGTADSIINNVTGYRIDPTNTKELARKVVALLKDAKLSRKLGNKGMRRVKSQFLWEHNVKKLVQVYKS